MIVINKIKDKLTKPNKKEPDKDKKVKDKHKENNKFHL